MFFAIDSRFSISYHFLSAEEKDRMLYYYSYNDIQSLPEDEIETYSDFLEDYEDSDLDPDDKRVFLSDELNIIFDSEEEKYNFTFLTEPAIFDIEGLPQEFYEMYMKGSAHLPDQFFKDINNVTIMIVCPVIGNFSHSLLSYTDTLPLFNPPLYGFSLDNLIKYLKVTKITPNEINIADGIYYIYTEDMLASEYALISNVQLPSVIDTKIENVVEFIKCMCQ